MVGVVVEGCMWSLCVFVCVYVRVCVFVCVSVCVCLCHLNFLELTRPIITIFYIPHWRLLYLCPSPNCDVLTFLWCHMLKNLIILCVCRNRCKYWSILLKLSESIHFGIGCCCIDFKEKWFLNKYLILKNCLKQNTFCA